MDLISKKSAVSRISDLLIIQLKGQRIPTWNEVYNAIGDIPSVPAVPLGPLCEFLAGNAWISCNTCNAVFGGCDENLRCGEDPKEWERILAKWMEEQDAAD